MINHISLGLLFLARFAGASPPTTPTIAISVADNGTASFSVQDGGNVKVDAAGNIDIYAATEIAFVFENGGKYAPVGIAFEQRSGAVADPIGKRNFQTRAITATTLTLSAAHLDASGFEYSITYKRTDGSVGVIDPRIINHGTN